LLTRTDQVSSVARDSIWREIEKLAAYSLRGEAIHRSVDFVNTQGEFLPLDQLRQQRVVAFSAIGNPAAFYRTLREQGTQIAAECSFPDHHVFTDHDVRRLTLLAQEEHVGIAICTGKDLVKLDQINLQPLSVWGLRIEMHFLHGEVAIRNAVLDAGKRVIKSPIRP
jgi:tetraacyldisaccharide 4'-kinase